MKTNPNINTWKKEIRSYDDRRNIVIPGDAAKTITFCAEQWIAIAQDAISTNNIFSVALSGGSTPKAIYEKLSSPEYNKRLDWNKILLFWSDERCVPPDVPDSNFNMAMHAGFSSLPIPPANIFRMPADVNDIEKGAKQYEDLILDKVPKAEFDLVMLGMGEDGHTASLFPKTHGLHSADRLVVANYIPQKDTWRMTMTFKCINAARHIDVYVLGKNKADMVKHVLTSPYQPNDLPIQRVGTPGSKAFWIMDTEAGRELD